MNEMVKEFICFLENKKNWLEQILRNNVQKKAMVQIDDQIVTIKSIEDIVEEIKIIIRFLSQTLEGEVKEKEIYNSSI